MASVLNIAAYEFTTLTGLAELRGSLRASCKRLGLKGTILLSPEGINLFLAGSEIGIRELLDIVRTIDGLEGLEVKASYSDRQPFSRMLVRLKKEIIAFGVDGIDPRQWTSNKVHARTLKQWLDEGRELTLLDVRNDYEVGLGTFRNARTIGIDHFRDFPAAVAKLPAELREKPVVMFCTGGIRCEKAGPLMERKGFRDVHQLDGGILKYFEECGDAHYDGDCFVFDHRVAVDTGLNETDAELCYACQAILSADDRESSHYKLGASCPHCFESDERRMEHVIESRHAHLREITVPLPGSFPHDNPRPMNVPQKFDRMPLVEFLAGFHPHVSRDEWLERTHAGRIVNKLGPVDADRIVRAGERFDHIIPADVEPDVSADISIIHEDEAIVVVNKPAPLPVHPSGRFNRNTLVAILNDLYRPHILRVVHRLDANTTGVMVLARSRTFAASLQPQFETGDVVKTYLARVIGHPEHDEFESDVAISAQPQATGLRVPDPAGLPAHTRFRVLSRSTDGTSLIEVRPISGRTNQIRIHLWDLGHPVAGDPSYLPNGKLGTSQTLSVKSEPMCLHAHSIELMHPVSRNIHRFETDLPDWTHSTVLGFASRSTTANTTEA